MEPIGKDFTPRSKTHSEVLEDGGTGPQGRVGEEASGF